MMSVGEMAVKLDGELMSASDMLSLGEQTLEHWITARDLEPTDKNKEGFRLLALHRQGAKGDPSFNACRETCRELVYYYNLITLDPEHVETLQRLNMMKLITSHLYYFITGKMEQSQLGEFCCSSKPIRSKLDGQIN
ncbi:MAG: hypothetical protein HOJ34_11375 [Kordiimonadaceae bacterium]|jgi:hypothetical protein|nr:hypothetical protein [Kordiimonadaceae bacterium]MBT6032634.1 hypothetical protein [Kordiimonadaceae bacterium]MBT6330373.1 hypothetical protein [Kordiimonadaceae bacterium]MBT7581902.1 hypothetical protein [Kordiimonadaceae bacterium]